jgi:hypothetical protein
MITPGFRSGDAAGTSDRTFIGNIEQISTRFAVHGISIMSLEATVRTAEAHLRRIEQDPRKVQKKCHTKDHYDYGY